VAAQGGAAAFGGHKGYGLAFLIQAFGLLAERQSCAARVQGYGFLFLVVGLSIPARYCPGTRLRVCDTDVAAGESDPGEPAACYRLASDPLSFRDPDVAGAMISDRASIRLSRAGSSAIARAGWFCHLHNRR
jgi:hypothetical protein